MKRPTQADVARLAGVSRATVSYVISGRAKDDISITEETRQRVLQAIERLGYQPDASAQSLRRGSTRTIGLLIPDLHNPHYWQIVRGVEEEVASQGYDLLFNSTSLNPERERECVRALLRRRIDGLILLLTYPTTLLEEARALIRPRSPLVLLGSAAQDMDTVLPSHGQGATQLMAHLLELGHRRIGLVLGVATPELGADRLAAYQSALHDHGLPVDETLIERCGSALDDGYQASWRLLQRQPRPTAIVVINDLLAIGALRAAADLGLRVPAEVSVASFDDIEVAAYLCPPLTTVRVNAEEMGTTAARLLFARLHDPERPPQHIRLPAQLVVRGSTGPAPAA
jgi:LacI family transcriptional regulator